MADLLLARRLRGAGLALPVVDPALPDLAGEKQVVVQFNRDSSKSSVAFHMIQANDVVQRLACLLACLLDCWLLRFCGSHWPWQVPRCKALRVLGCAEP